MFFRYVGNKTSEFSSKKRIFCPKTTKFGPKLAFLVNLGQGMHLVPCWRVGWWLWRAGCISQDTYLLYDNICCIAINIDYRANCGVGITVGKGSCKKFADLAAGRPLASSSTHKRRRKDRDGVHDALLQALMDGVGSTHDKLMGLEAIDSKSGLF